MKVGQRLLTVAIRVGLARPLTVTVTVTLTLGLDRKELGQGRVQVLEGSRRRQVEHQQQALNVLEYRHL